MSILPLTKENPAFESVQNCREMLNKVIFDVSHITKSMHTDRISDIGIDEAIRFELDTLRKTGLVKVDFSVSEHLILLIIKKQFFYSGCSRK